MTAVIGKEVDSLANDVHFSIQFVSKVTGINAHTIRAWEKRYSAVTPGRDPNGRRIYTQDEIDRLNVLGHLVNEGHTISEVAARKTPELQEILGRFPKADLRENDEILPNDDFDTLACLQNINMGLSFFKLDIISHELEKAQDSLSPKDFAYKLVAPLLLKISGLKKQNTLSKLNEEALISIIKFHLKQKLYSVHSHQTNENLVIFVSKEGDQNEIEMMMAALLCKHYKIHFYSLSQELSPETVSSLADQFKAKAIILMSDDKSGLNNLENYAMEIRESLPWTNLWFYGKTSPTLQMFQNKMSFIENAEMLEGKLIQL